MVSICQGFLPSLPNTSAPLCIDPQTQHSISSCKTGRPGSGAALKPSGVCPKGEGWALPHSSVLFLGILATPTSPGPQCIWAQSQARRQRNTCRHHLSPAHAACATLPRSQRASLLCQDSAGSLCCWQVKEAIKCHRAVSCHALAPSSSPRMRLSQAPHQCHCQLPRRPEGAFWQEAGV